MKDIQLLSVLRNIELDRCTYMGNNIFYVKKIVQTRYFDCYSERDKLSRSEEEFLIRVRSATRKPLQCKESMDLLLRKMQGNFRETPQNPCTFYINDQLDSGAKGLYSTVAHTKIPSRGLILRFLVEFLLESKLQWVAE